MVNVIEFAVTKTGRSVLIKLSSQMDNAVIHYTLDGSIPSAQSNEYFTPFEVFENVTVKAIASKEGLLDSDVVSLNIILENE